MPVRALLAIAIPTFLLANGGEGAGRPIAEVSAPEARVAVPIARCGTAARVTCVVDGDTLWLEGAKIRLADIDTPEISQPRCPAERALGKAATERLVVLLNEAPFTLARSGAREEDRYGRKLRLLLRDGQSLGTRLVAEGLATPWPRPADHSWCPAADSPA